MKCETPARDEGSSRDPVAIQSPSAADRTPRSGSVAMRSPPGSVVICGSRTARIVSSASHAARRCLLRIRDHPKWGIALAGIRR